MQAVLKREKAEVRCNASSGWVVALELEAPERSMAVYRQGARFSGVIWSFGFGSPSLNLLSLFSAQHSSLGTAGDAHSLDKPHNRGWKFGRLELRSQKGWTRSPYSHRDKCKAQKTVVTWGH